MSRVGTLFLNLGKWLDGENPGSGPQDMTESDGLNGDKNKIDRALGTGHNTDGTHKAGVIDAANLAATSVDGSSLEQDAISKKLRVKDGGITAAKLAQSALDMFTAITTAFTTALNTHKASSDHDDYNDERYAPISIVLPTTRTRSIIPFSISSSPDSHGRAVFGNYVPSSMSDIVGLPMPRNGCIVGFAACNTSGGVSRHTLNYNDQGEHYFVAGDVITVIDIGTDCYPCINGAALNVMNLQGAGTVRVGAIEVETQ